MSSRSERERLITIGSKSPLAKHSMNQKMTKLSLEGERRLGIREQRRPSEFSQTLDELRGDELFIFFCGEAASFERDNLPLPARIGLFSLGISSLINAKLREDPQAFVEEMAEGDLFTFDSGSPFERLMPREKMVANFIKKSKMPHKPENVYRALRGAGVFAHNFGALDFGQGEEIAAVYALMAVHNLATHLGSEIRDQNLSVKLARMMVVVFGETVNSHLRALKPKKNVEAR